MGGGDGGGAGGGEALLISAGCWRGAGGTMGAPCCGRAARLGTAGGIKVPVARETPAICCSVNKWQATRWSGEPGMGRNGGSTFEHTDITIGHRVWKRHPLGGAAGLGTSPFRMILFRLRVGSGIGMAERSAWV